MVCLSVSLSVTLVSPAKMVAPIEMPFGLKTRVGQRNHELDGDRVHILPWEGAILRGEGASHSKVLGHSVVIFAKNAEPIKMPFGLWTRMGRRKHEFNCIHQVVPMCTSSIVIVFAMWSQCALLGGHIGTTWQYDSTVHLRWRCGLLSNYLDYLLLYYHYIHQFLSR